MEFISKRFSVMIGAQHTMPLDSNWSKIKHFEDTDDDDFVSMTNIKHIRHMQTKKKDESRYQTSREKNNNEMVEKKVNNQK